MRAFREDDDESWDKLRLLTRILKVVVVLLFVALVAWFIYIH